MSDEINLQNSTQSHARRFTRPLNNYQVVAQNIRAADVLTHNQ